MARTWVDARRTADERAALEGHSAKTPVCNATLPWAITQQACKQTNRGTMQDNAAELENACDDSVGTASSMTTTGGGLTAPTNTWICDLIICVSTR
eukprot:5024013-Amphidinium_carterae.1